jgi:hypothetical protein
MEPCSPTRAWHKAVIDHCNLRKTRLLAYVKKTYPYMQESDLVFTRSARQCAWMEYIEENSTTFTHIPNYNNYYDIATLYCHLIMSTSRHLLKTYCNLLKT